MGERKRTAHTPPPVSRSLCSLVVARDGMLALIVAGRERWREANGYTFIPSELPAGDLAAETGANALPQVVATIARRWLGCDATLLPNDATYGPSARHAIDRVALAADEGASAPLPLLYLERGMPLDALETAGAQDSGDPPAFTRVVVRAYRAALVAEAQASAAETAGVLWLAPQALRVALRGVPLADLLAQRGVELQPVPHLPLPSDAFIFVPADNGERHLLRIAAKYGPDKLGLPVTIRGESR